MHTVLVVVLFIVGLILIIKGGDWFVDAATWIAKVSGIPQFVIGATIVSVATTLPELLVSLIAAIDGSSGMAIGNAVGSVTANTGLILGVSIFCLPALFNRKQNAIKGIMMLAACVVLLVFSFTGTLGTLGSIILLVLFVIFTIANVIDAKKGIIEERNDDDNDEAELKNKKIVGKNIVKFIAGAAGIAIGAQLLVDNGTEIALMLGVPEGIVGVTIVAVGTSLPEFVTTITAISRKESALSLGNIIGANVMDLTVILPICTLINPAGAAFDAQSSFLDLPVCLLIGVVGIIPALAMGKTKRVQGIALMALYAAYVAFLVWTCLDPSVFEVYTQFVAGVLG